MPKTKKSLKKTQAIIKEQQTQVPVEEQVGFVFGDHLLDTKDDRVFEYSPEHKDVVESNPTRFIKTEMGATKWKP